MKNPPTFARFLILLLALGAIICFIAGVNNQRVAALAVNGKIAFTLSSNTIYTINPDGLGLVQLTQTGNGFTDRSPAWSPDGTKIAFSRTTFTVQSQIYVMNADGTNPTRITNNSAGDTQPTWSPDGTKIAFVSNRDGNNEIYVMNADGSNQVRLTNDPGFDIDPAWSPDGTKIAFTSSRDFPGITGNIALGFELYTINADGSNPIRLTNNSNVDAGPSWSPDGTKIAFNTQRDGLPLVYVMNANGSNPINITQSTTLDSGDPEWSPDGTTIAFTSFGHVGIGNVSAIFLMNADGSNIRRLSNISTNEHELAWQPLGAAPTPTPTPSPTPTPPIPTYTISGTVTDNNGQPLAGVPVSLVSNVVATQIVFTNQTGNYNFTYQLGSHSLGVSPSKAGYSFNPLSITFVSSGSVSGDQTASFVGTPSPGNVIQIPILLARDSFQHALALDSVTLTGEPFGISTDVNFSSDHRTRVALFALNLDLEPNENVAAVTAEAEDSLGTVYPLTIESIVAVPNFTWLKQVVVKLPDEIADKVEVRVRIKARTFFSNKVIIKIKP